MKKSKKTILTLVSLAVLLFALVGTTLAYLTTSTPSVVNTFTPTSVPIKIEEKTDNGVKSEVKITNNGDIDAYIRVAVVITWKNDAGNVYGTKPVEGTDYTVKWTKDGWVKSGDYYYYTSAVVPNGSTGILLTGCEPMTGRAPDGYDLSVEILAQSIQAVPEQAVKDAWNVTVGTDGKLSIS